MPVKFLSIIIPTYNEAENISGIINRITSVLKPCDISYEIIIVDDSSLDGTPDIARQTLADNGFVVSRQGKDRCLATSVIEGIARSCGEYIVLMDADASHPPELLPEIISKIRDGYDLIVPSRYVKGGGFANFPLSRRVISSAACIVGRSITKIKDNTSGYFCIKKNALEGVNLTCRGFKIGLEVFVKAHYKRAIEIPYIFYNRTRGKSKLRMMPILQYFQQVFSLLFYKR